MAMPSPTPRRQLSIFVCHSSDDKSMVRDLAGRLRSCGFDPWLDSEKLLPGQDWDLEIRGAVSTCDVVIVCLSPTTVTKSGYINKELKYVLDVAAEKQEGSTFVIPVKLRECRIPETLRRWQWADLAHADGYERLVYALRVQAEVRGLFAEAVLHKEALLISSEAAAAPDESSNGEDLVFGATYAQTIRQLRRLMDKCDSPPIGNAEVPSWAADLPLEMDTLPVADNAMVLNAIVQWPLDAKDPNALDWSTWRTDAEFHSLEGLWSSRWRFSSTVRTAGWHEGTAMVRTKGDWVLIQYKDSTNLYFIRARRIGLSRLVGRYLNAEVIEDTTAWVGIVVDNRRIDGFWFSPHHGRWDLKR